MNHLKVCLTSILIVAAINLSGCEGPRRNTPKLQVEDMEICRKGGMVAYLNLRSEIGCQPKPEEYAKPMK